MNSNSSSQSIIFKEREREKSFMEAEYEDLLGVMADKLDAEAFVSELCNGFNLLCDPIKGLITPESLHKNGELVLGLQGMSAEDAESMVREGDRDGDGALNQMEFCVLMVRLSPDMMEDADIWLQKAIKDDFDLLESK